MKRAFLMNYGNMMDLTSTQEDFNTPAEDFGNNNYNSYNGQNGMNQMMPENEADVTGGDGDYPYQTLPSYPVPPEDDIGNHPIQTLPSYPVPPDDTGNHPIQTLPSFPVPPDDGFYVPNQRPSYPITGIGPIIIPITPGGVGYAQVRFLHAVAGADPVMILVGPTVISQGLGYENVTPYNRIASGYRTITVISTTNPTTILLRRSLTFTAGSQVTIALVNAASGIQLLEVSDTLCSNKSWNSSCLRFVNLSYGSGGLGVQLRNGTSVFDNIEFMEVTPFKQIARGSYSFVVYQSAQGIQPRSIPGYHGSMSFELQAGVNDMYTVYLVGSVYTSPYLQAVIVANS